MKKIFLLPFLLLNIAGFSQVTNDNCATAQAITIPTSGNICVTSTTVNALSNNTNDACDTGAPGNEVWFTFIATGSQNTVTVTPTGGGGGIQQAIVSLDGTGCADAAYNICNASPTNGGTATATWTYTIGAQVWVSVESNNGVQGSFNICVTSITTPPTPGSSCATATVLCNKSNFSLATFPNTNNGFQPDCFLSTLQRPIFYQFTVGVSGTCIWSADPQGNAEYDWALYNITGGCPGTLVCCNYNFADETGSPIGMATGGAGACGTSGLDGAAFEVSPPSNLTAGQTYVLIIDNYSNNNVGFNMTWGGTFDIAPSAQFTVNPATACGSANVAINNTSIAATSYSWNLGNGNTSTATNPPNQTYSTPGTYLISLVATSATGCTDVASQAITINTIPTVTVPANINVCAGATIAATSFTSNPVGATFTWTNSNTAINLAANGTGNIGSFTATNATGSAITSTITVTPTLNGCAGTASTYTITVNPSVTPTFTAHAAICSGGTITLPTTSNNGITGTWSPAVNNTATTPYTFTPTAGQCATTATMTVTVNNPTTPTFTQVPAICNGGSFTLPTTSNNGITGTWSPAVNNTATTPYTFTPTAGQCATTATMTVTVNNPTTPTFTQVPAICNGGTFTLPTTSNNSITGTWSPAINNTNTTTYTFTPTAGQCATTTTMTVTVNQIPTVTVPTNISACPNDVIPVTNYTSNPAGATFAWTNSNTAIGLGANGIGNTPSFTATNGTGSSISGTISVTPSLNGCSGTPTTYTITVNDLFDPTITPTGPFCVSATPITLTAVDGGGTWSGNGITNSATGTFDPTAAGIGTHLITYTIAGSCGGTDTENIIVNPDLDATITPAGPFCPGDLPVTLDAVDGGGTWSGNGITDVNAGTFDPSSAGTGTHTITYTIAGACGDIQTIDIVVSGQLDATITPAGPFCESSISVTLESVDLGGTWSGNGITDANAGTFDPASAGAGSHTITYTIAGTCGATDTEVIVVDPDMNATITAAGPFCTNDPAVALDAVDNGGTWSGTGITNASLGIFDPSIALDGTHTITYEITGACGDLQTVDIVVSDQMNATITPVADVCEQDASFDLTAVDNGGTWSGNGITDINAGTFDPATAGAGSHIITYTIGGNCGDIQTTTINVLANADATITQAGPFCTGNTSVTLVAANNGGTWGGNGITNTATGTFDPATAGVGTHTITYTIAGQCGDTHSIDIVVVSNFDATITQVGPFCQDASSVDLSTVDGGGTFTGNGITDAVNGIFNPTSAGPGTHTITYTIPGACGDVESIDIVVNPVPVVTFSVDNPTGCIPVTATFTDNSGIAGATSLWTISDGFTSNSSGSITHVFNAEGCFNVTLELTSSAGCTSSSTQNNIVCVSAIPVAEFIWTPTNATILNPTVNFTNQSIGATDYFWDFSGLGNSILSDPSFVFPGDTATVYEVCLLSTSADGCFDTVCHDITIYDEFLVYVPNTFTPDNDGINDVFIPIINGYDPLSYEFMIFNRWGELIFQTQHPDTGWDGSHKSLMSQEDTYVWKIKLKSTFDNKLHEYVGHVNLLK